jgi:hypothetical protein
MPTVTSENKAQFDREFMEKKSSKNTKHSSENLPETQGAKLESRNKERHFHHGMQHANEQRRSLYMKNKGWKDSESKFYDKEMNTPPKDPTKWAHMVQTVSHPEMGARHIVLSQDPLGYSISHYSKGND